MSAVHVGGAKRRRREGERRALIARFAASGLSVKAFCKREGVSAQSFHRWRRALGAVGDEIATRGEQHARGSDAFIDLGALSGERQFAAGLEIRLELPGGVVLQLVRR